MKRKTIAAAMLAAAVLMPGGCKSSKDSAGKSEISVSGAWALYPLTQAWGEEYHKVNPSVTVNVSGGGAGKGATDVLSGMAEIGMISREAKQEEIDRGGFFVAVAKDAVVAVVSAKNPELAELLKRGLTREGVEKLWIGGQAAAWGEVADTKSTEAVRVYTRADSCGAAESWAKFAGGKKMSQEDLKGTGVNADPGLLDAVRKDPNGVGYNNYSYIYDSKTGEPVEGVVPVPIDVNGNGAVDEDERVDTRDRLQAAIRKGVYPHPPARPLYLMTKGKPAGASKDFIKWILTDGQKFVEGAGYITAPDDILKKQISEIGGK